MVPIRTLSVRILVRKRTGIRTSRDSYGPIFHRTTISTQNVRIIVRSKVNNRTVEGVRLLVRCRVLKLVRHHTTLRTPTYESHRTVRIFVRVRTNDGVVRWCTFIRAKAYET